MHFRTTPCVGKVWWGESARTENPAQKTGFFGVKWGRRREAVDAGNPLQYKDFPLMCALSGSWIDHCVSNPDLECR